MSAGSFIWFTDTSIMSIRPIVSRNNHECGFTVAVHRE